MNKVMNVNEQFMEDLLETLKENDMLNAEIITLTKEEFDEKFGIDTEEKINSLDQL